MNNTSYQDRPELFIVDQLRKSLNGMRFNEIELSNLIGSNVTLAFWEYSEKKFQLHKEIARFIYVYLVQDLYQLFYFLLNKGTYKVSKDSVFIEALSNESRLRELWLPVAQNYPNDQCVLITESELVKSKYESDYTVVVPKKMNFIFWIQSRVYILINCVRILKRLKSSFNFTKEFSVKLRLFSLVIEQLNRTVKAAYLMKEFNPKCFVTSWDWYPIGAVYCNVFKKEKVKSYTFIHGAIGKQSFIEFVPLNADYIFAWGNHNIQNLLKHGIHRDAILNVGSQRMKKYEAPHYNEILNRKKNFDIHPQKKVIGLLYTAILTPYWIEDSQRLIKELGSHYEFICRPHPSTSEEKIKAYIPEGFDVKLITPSHLPIVESLELMDVIITDSSTAGFDAICMNKTVIVLDSAAELKTQDVMLDACDAHAAIFCRTTFEAIKIIDRVINDIDYGDSLNENRNKFIKDFISSYGNDATENIVRMLNQDLNT